MKSALTTGIMMATAFALSLYAPGRVRADDERDEVEIRVRAPLEAVDCSAAKQTITMFGGHLVVDVTTTGDCQSLADALAAAQAAGQVTMVTVKLADEVPPFMATRVRMDGEDGGGSDDLARHDGGGGSDVEIQAPARDVHSATGSFTLLSLPIDASHANLNGAGDDDDDEGENQPIDLTQLMEGQFVEAKLVDATSNPLAAREVEIKNFNNGTDCTVVDEDGNDVDDADADVEVQVTANPRGAGMRKMRFTVRSNGHFVLRGLPTGSTKMVVRRTWAGSTAVGRRRVKIKPNVTRRVRVMLRSLH